MTDEEDVTAQLLRLAGARPDPPAERTARVRAVVHREWLVGRRRRVVRRSAAIAVLGIAASLVMAVWMNRPRPGRCDARATSELDRAGSHAHSQRRLGLANLELRAQVAYGSHRRADFEAMRSIGSRDIRRARDDLDDGRREKPQARCAVDSY